MIKPPLSFLKSLDKSTLRFILGWLFFSLVIHIITAFFSLGFHHYDEHFQLLEFAALKLGKTTPVELAWEYPARIRPTLQPYIALYVVKLFNIHEPFNAALVLRQISGLLGWFSISLFTICVIQWFKSQHLRKLLILITALLWFLPYTHVRFSSESWSASFFFIGLSALFISQAAFRRPSLSRELSLVVTAGICFGLSYIFRMQSVLLLPGVFLWYLLIGRMKFYKLFLMGIAVLATMLVGVYLDYLFYGTWVNTALRYFQVNIIEGKAATFGVDPWWYYFRETFNKGIFPINILMIVCLIVAWVRNPKNILTWAVVPFFIIHCMVSHKELRFIFPITNAIPVFMIMSVAGLNRELWNNLSGKLQKAGKWILIIIFAVSTVAMIVVSFQPVRREFKIFQYFNKTYYDTEISIIGYHHDPYGSFSHLPMNFYKPRHFHTYNTNDLKRIQYIIRNTDHPVFLYSFEKGYKLPPEIDSLTTPWKAEYFTLPKSIGQFNFNNWVDRTTIGAIYNLKPEPTESEIKK